MPNDPVPAMGKTTGTPYQIMMTDGETIETFAEDLELHKIALSIPLEDRKPENIEASKLLIKRHANLLSSVIFGVSWKEIERDPELKAYLQACVAGMPKN